MTGCPRCEELEAEVRDLKRDLYGMGWEPPAELGLTRQETIVLQTLMASERVTPRWLLFNATREASKYGDDVHIKIVDVVVSKVRSKIRPYGCEIKPVYSHGYRLPADSRARLLNWRQAA